MGLNAEHTEEEIQARLRQLAREVLDEVSALDPPRTGDLLWSFVSELFLSSTEEQRQKRRRQRQAEGIAAAKARGVRFGPAPKPLPENFAHCCEAWRSGQLTATQAAEACGLSRKSFCRAARKREEELSCRSGPTPR